MAKYQCNTCRGTYSDVDAKGAIYAHVCPTEIISHSEFDANGIQAKPETRSPLANRRDENPPPGLEFRAGVAYIVTADPHDKMRHNAVPADSLIVAEGAGRTLLED